MVNIIMWNRIVCSTEWVQVLVAAVEKADGVCVGATTSEAQRGTERHREEQRGTERHRGGGAHFPGSIAASWSLKAAS